MWGRGQGAPWAWGSPRLAAHPLGQALPVPSHPQVLLPGGTKSEEGLGSPSSRAAQGVL